MKIFKPKFWEKINLISIFLYPASLILQLLIATKKIFISQNSFKIPIICIGNIYLGGTGKTPLSILITRELIKKLYRPTKKEHDFPGRAVQYNKKADKHSQKKMIEFFIKHLK